ncbi:Protein of unknown function (DUF820) [Gloeocapsa sp. PCC 73106]|nr:Protein of unknown function (DUF820) [Gloeocapsa sp. PCC 73106]
MEIAASIAPEICVEIISEGNTKKEMEIKKLLYLEAKAIEVWFCEESGTMRFFNQQGELKQSLLVPDFPKQVKR